MEALEQKDKQNLDQDILAPKADFWRGLIVVEMYNLYLQLVDEGPFLVVGT